MTKRQELDLLDKTITALGKESYLGPWLAASRAQIERDITSDLFPQAPMPGAAYAEGALIVEAAKVEAKKIREQAQQYADGARDGALERAAQIRAEARRAIERIANQL